MVQVLEEIGRTTNHESFRDVIGDYKYMLKLRGGFLANRMNIRLSSHLLERLHEDVRRHQSAQTVLRGAAENL